MNRIREIWINLRSSLWVVPAGMIIGAVALAIGLIEIDIYFGHIYVNALPLLFGAGAEGARGMLQAIAGSMMTVAALTFSLTIVAIAQASSQYTSRILRNFMRDRANQIVLGFFVGIFTYCLIVLRTIRGSDSFEFVPSLAVTFGLALALVGIGVIIFFIHHIASSLQASSIISSIAFETIRAVKHLFPKDVGDAAEEEEIFDIAELIASQHWTEVPSSRTGYIQSIATDSLLSFAQEHNVIIRMDRSIGDFVIEGATIASLAINGKPPAGLVESLNSIYAINHFRTVDQDASFGIRQQVDIALKALSPGINDTTTALVCLDYLGAILRELACRHIESRYRSESGEVLVIAKGPTFAGLITAAFDQIRENSAGNSAVILRILATLENIAQKTSIPRRRRILLQQVQLTAAMADRTLETTYDRSRILSAVEAALEALGERPESHVLSLLGKEENR